MTSSTAGRYSGLRDWLAGPPPASLEGKVVVLTGAAGGIGRALARAFAAEGARLALCDRDTAPLDTLAAGLGGVPCTTHAFDVVDEAACRDALADVIARWGGVDVVVNNAGITHRSAFADTEPEVIRRVMAVNFFGAVHVTKAVLESVVARRGAIVALSSVAGFAPLVGRTGYAASKHALHGFFDTLRAELAGTGVHVLLVCPAFTDTPIEVNALGGRGGPAEDGGRVIVGRMVPPEEVAAALINALRRRRRLLVHTPVAKLSFWLTRLAPSLYERLMRRSQQR
jgi:NAD(P)-dependent dehydrogenase (short-subunit alcohol dehydrogenase family)